MSLIVTLWCLFLFRSVSVSSSLHTDSCLWLLTFFLHFALSQRTSPWMVMYSISFIINELVEFRGLFNDSRVLHRIWRDKSHRTVESLITDSLIIYSLEPLDASSQGCPRRSHRCHECASEGRSWHRSKGWGKCKSLWEYVISNDKMRTYNAVDLTFLRYIWFDNNIYHIFTSEWWDVSHTGCRWKSCRRGWDAP